MELEIKKIISNLFPNQELQKIKETEGTIVKIFGENFFKKHIKTIYWNHQKLIIQTQNIEAKTEINLIKKQFSNTTNIIIK